LALSVVIPAFDEGTRLPRSLEGLAGQLDPDTSELIVVDDGSRDGTAEVARALLGAWPHGRLIRSGANRGKGHAVRSGVLASSGRRVVYLDADSATDAACLPALLHSLETADVAVGSRALAQSVIGESPAHRALMGQLYNRLVRSVSDLDLRDTQCGFKAFRAPVAKLVFAMSSVDGFAFDVEVLHLAQRLGFRIAEVPVHWQHVDGSKVRKVRDSTTMALDTIHAVRADRHQPLTCLHLDVAAGEGAAAALMDLPADTLVSWDRGTIEVVFVGSDDAALPKVQAMLADHGIGSEPLLRSGAELLQRSRHGRMAVSLPELNTSRAAVGHDVSAPRRGARIRMRRALRRGKYLAGHHPISLPILLRCTPLGASRAITAHTDLVVEGFPRSGNTFVVAALRDAAGPRLEVVSHVHHPAQVKLAVRRRVPTVLMLRAPLPTLASYLVAGPHGTPEGVLREYVGYHRELLPCLGDVEVADFDEVIRDLRPLIERLNDRYGLAIPAFDNTPASVKRVFAAIEERHLGLVDVSDPEPTVPRPSGLRSEANRVHRQALQRPELAELLEEAEHLHALFIDRSR
jgi:hypothetical protein